jgi:nucleoside-diphosphate-sugar epimerase
VGARDNAADAALTVAVTGPTGTFGFGLMPLLQADPRIGRVTGVARRPFDPAARGWTKLRYRRGDVRDTATLTDAFRGADVVVHLAFMVTGAEPPGEIRQTNVGGTVNAYRAAATAGARRFVYASSVAAYGFHSDNPAEMTEDWPVRPAARLFYARQKAELEQLLTAEAAGAGQPELYLLRPCVVVGPHAVGAKDLLPGPLAPLGRRLADAAIRFRPPIPVPVAAPALPLQLVHEQDVGSALLLCTVGAGPPGAYNIAADGIITPADIMRELGLLPVPLPAAPAQAVARLLTALPALPGVAGWAEAVSRPAIMSTTRAKELLGWSPRFTALEALRDTMRGPPAP